VDNGAGGSAIGAFRATLTIPEPFAWTNADAVSDIPRNQALAVTWSGGNAGGEVVQIVGASLDPTWGVVGSFLCTERSTAGTFRVPAAILSALPVATASTGSYPSAVLSVSAQPLAATTKFTAPGLDLGCFLYTVEHIRSVQFK